MTALLAAVTPDGTLSLNTLKVLILAGAAVGLFALGRSVRAAFPSLPLSRTQRERLAAAGPFLELLAWLLLVTWATAWLLDAERTATTLTLAILAVTLITASWFAIRDYVAGVIVRVERLAAVGDRVRVGDVEGRIVDMGVRVAQIQTAGGDLVLLPLSRLAGAPVVRGPRTAHAAVHTFAVAVPPGARPTEVAAAARRAALLCPWSAPRHPPAVRHVGLEAIEVSVRPLVEGRVADVEGAVRDAVREAFAPRADPAGG